jgi:hypothetical protein
MQILNCSRQFCHLLIAASPAKLAKASLPFCSQSLFSGSCRDTFVKKTRLAAVRFLWHSFLISLFSFLSCVTGPKTEPFTVNLKSPYEGMGSAEVYTDKSFSLKGEIKTIEVEIFYYPVEDAVCLQFKVMFVDCRQFWDRAGRLAFIGALERYNEDFERRNLPEGNKRQTRKAYGSSQVFFAWKKTPVAVQAYAPAKIELGYHRKDRSAFFSTTQLEADYQDPISRTRSQVSPVTEMYFTRAQAEALATLFTEANRRTEGPPLPVFDPGGNIDFYEE